MQEWKPNYQQLIKENDPERFWEEILYGGMWELHDDDDNFIANSKFFAFLNNLNYEFIESARSTDDNHDVYFSRFKLDDKIFEVMGSYSSYDGINFYDPYNFYEVKPIQKTITVYEKI